MKKFRISYFYLATGMEGNADTLPEMIVHGKTKEEAMYNYWKSNGHYAETTFEEFQQLPSHEKDWGLSIKEVT